MLQSRARFFSRHVFSRRGACAFNKSERGKMPHRVNVPWANSALRPISRILPTHRRGSYACQSESPGHVIVKIRRYSGIAKKKPLRDCPAEPPPWPHARISHDFIEFALPEEV